MKGPHSKDIHQTKSKDELIEEIKRLNGIISRQSDIIKTNTQEGTINPSEIFGQAFVCYEPDEVKQIMIMLGENPISFGKRFGVSDSAAKSWMTPKGLAKHAECLGAAGKLMYWAAVVANSKGSANGNLVRLKMK